MVELILYYLFLQNNLIKYIIYLKKIMELICSNEHLCLCSFGQIYFWLLPICLLSSNRARAPPSQLENQIQVN